MGSLTGKSLQSGAPNQDTKPKDAYTKHQKPKYETETPKPTAATQHNTRKENNMKHLGNPQERPMNTSINPSLPLNFRGLKRSPREGDDAGNV